MFISRTEACTLTSASGVVGWCNGPGSMPGRPTSWMIVGQGPIALAVGASGVV